MSTINPESIGLLKSKLLNTPLGPMIAVADEEALYLLEFVDRSGLEKEIDCVQIKARSCIEKGETAPIVSIEKELSQYFSDGRNRFQTPIRTTGSLFQNKVWKSVQMISCDQTRSYSEVAQNICRPSAVRAVARAIGANQLAIIIPCHRVIGLNHSMKGYSGGIARKCWLLNHERSSVEN